MKIGLIREGKIPEDSRVALTPAQCKWLKKNHDIEVKVQPSQTRCYTDKEYISAGVELNEDVTDCDYLFGIKEVPVNDLIPGKTYLFFSHTKKLQPYNQKLLQTIITNGNTLIDYECLEHEDGARIIGFGFFAGVVGAHNGMMAYGNRTAAYSLKRVFETKSFRQLIHTYFGLKLPPMKIAVTGSGRVAHGILEIMNLLGIHEAEPDDYLEREFTYPVYVHLKAGDLYERKDNGTYNRADFHANPAEYRGKFKPYVEQTDVLMNGVYWDENIPRLFESEDMKEMNFRIKTIADVTDDRNGSIPCNISDSTIEEPVYGVDRNSFEKTVPYLNSSVDVMAVGNLPNELPRDASRYFGEQLIKHVLADLFSPKSSRTIERATIVKSGKLTEEYAYMTDYAHLTPDT